MHAGGAASSATAARLLWGWRRAIRRRDAACAINLGEGKLILYLGVTTCDAALLASPLQDLNSWHICAPARRLESSMKSNAVTSFELEMDWTAQTFLPIEFRGQELKVEARAYQGTDPNFQALVLVHRDENAGNEVPVVRVHSGCVTGDIFHSLRCDCYPQLQASMDRILTSPVGVLVYLPYQEGRGIGLVNKIRAYALQDKGYDTVDANVAIGAPIEARDYDLAAHILFDLGYPEIKLLTNNPAKVEALREEGLEVIEQLPLIVKASPYNTRYLATKKERMAHKL